MEQPIFCVGDKAVCVDSSNCNSLLVEGKIYLITDVRRCPGCGGVGVCVGIIFAPPAGYNQSKMKCTVCGHISDRNPEIGFRQTRFVPLETDKAIEREIHEALKGVPC